MATMIEPLKWTRRSKEQDYVATDGDTIYCIFGERNDWDVGVLGDDGHWKALRHPETNRQTPGYHTLALAKLAADVVRIVGVEVLFEHVTDTRTVLAGGGWGGHPRSYIGKAKCSCGWEGGNYAGVREARAFAADHVQYQFEKALRPEKVT